MPDDLPELAERIQALCRSVKRAQDMHRIADGQADADAAFAIEMLDLYFHASKSVHTEAKAIGEALRGAGRADDAVAVELLAEFGTDGYLLTRPDWMQLQERLQRIANDLHLIGKDPEAETPPPPPEATPQTPEAASQEWESLTDRQQECLQALLELNALEHGSRQTRAAIAVKVEGRDANANGFGIPLADLVRRGLVQSKTGRDGGCWLTPEGRGVLPANLTRSPKT